MRKKILGITSLFIIMTALFASSVPQPKLSQNGSTLPANNQQSDAPLGANAVSSQPAGTAAAPDLSQTTGQDVQHAVSTALRDIPIPLETPPASISESGPPEAEAAENDAFTGPVLPQVTDPVRQFSLGPNAPLAPAMTSLLNFAGVNSLNFVYPADTTGDVGPNHYVQWVNKSFEIFDKTGASLFGPISGNLLWTNLGAPCGTYNDGDVQVLYDSLADRWVMGQFIYQSGFGECLAVSTTADPTGSYNLYFFRFSNTIFYDYPKLGLWPDGYYLTSNLFTGTSGPLLGASVIAFKRSDLLAGQTTVYQEFQTHTTSYGTLLPANLNGSTTPPAGEPMFIAEIGDTALHLWKLHIDWTDPLLSSFTGPVSLPVASFNPLCAVKGRNCIPQPGITVGLDGVGDRLMQRLQYRNFGTYEALVVNHSVNAASSGQTAGVRWYEIRDPNGTPTIYQQGTWAPDESNRWMGSIAMDQDGNIALGYSISSDTLYPGIRYTGRMVTDALGVMTEGESVLVDGSGSQTGLGYRWGDYSNMVLDPSDNCTFWYTTEYMATTGEAPWVTRIGSFKFPSCGTQPIPTSTPFFSLWLPFIQH